MKIASNGIRISVDEQGSGDLALVFLHYWGGTSRTWRHVTAPLANSYRTIAVDSRGWGASDGPATGYSVADLADDVAGVVEALDLRRYVLVGHSMGGKVAQLLASRKPEGLAGLILVGSTTPTPLALPPELRDAQLSAYSTRETVEATIDYVLTAKPLSQRDREQVITDSLGGAPQAKKAWPVATSQEDISSSLSAISVPTLIIVAELDQVDTVAATRAELLPRIPHAILRLILATGHLAPLESPEDLVKLIDKFAAQLT